MPIEDPSAHNVVQPCWTRMYPTFHLLRFT